MWKRWANHLILFTAKLSRRVCDSWWRRTCAAWRRERSIWRRTKNPPSQRHYTGGLMLLISLPAMWYVALHTGWMVWLSFTFSAFLAISYATFFSKPQIFFFIFIGLIIGGVGQGLFFDAKDAALLGDWMGALVILGVGLYVLVWSNQLKAGNAPIKSPAPRERRASNRSRRRG